LREKRKPIRKPIEKKEGEKNMKIVVTVYD